ncbi:MAG: sigma-70 family RNA polymerase sigma factor [Nitrospirae bacterium]|nr:sigma-70 family RNA polymerase sigma factor [Nitrospirota bacterium]
MQGLLERAPLNENTPAQSLPKKGNRKKADFIIYPFPGKGREYNSLAAYLRDISKIDRIDQDTTNELAIASQNGNEEARNKLISANLRLVVYVASKITYVSGRSMLELISDGNLGLFKAVKLYDPSLGYKFSTYAQIKIENAIIDGLSERQLISIPEKLRSKYRRVRKAIDQHVLLNGQEPDIKTISTKTGFNEKLVVHILTLPHAVSPNDDSKVKHALESFTDFRNSFEDDFYRRELLHKALDTLTPRQRYILERRYGLSARSGGATQAEIAKELNTTADSIWLSEKRAMNKIRKYFFSHGVTCI